MGAGSATAGAVLARPAAGLGAIVAVVLLCFVGTQVDQDARYALYAAERVGEARCCGEPPVSWVEVLESATVAAAGVPAIAALAHLAMILVRAAAAGISATMSQTRRTYIAVAVVGGWTLVFLAFGWRP